jgi:hypothetical protein
MKKPRRTWEQMYPLYTRYRSSGQTIESFCQSEGINKHTFNYWRLKIINSEGDDYAGKKSNGFQQIIPRGSSASNEIVLHLPQDIQITLPLDYPAESIGAIIKSVSC